MASQPRIRRGATYPAPVALAAAESCPRVRLRRVAVAAAALAAAAVLALGGAAAYAASQPTCGLEEHEHASACYESVLACGYEEGEELEDGSAHEHAEECYTQELSCGLAEHAHSESCYSEQEELLGAVVAAVTGEDAEESGSAAAADEDADEDETFNGYIKSESLQVSVADGYGALDAVEYDDDGNAVEDEAGNDSSTSNGTVRTFDDVVYTFSMLAELRDSSSDAIGTATFCMKVTMELDLYEAKFDIDKMTWAESTGNWQINYYDNAGDLVCAQTEDGLVSADGTELDSFNDIVGTAAESDASEATLETTYGSKVASQELVASIDKSSDTSGLEIENWKCFIYVMAAASDTEISPKFSFYLQGNESNLNASGQAEASTLDMANSGDTGSTVVSVTAAQRYNVYLGGASRIRAGSFDFTTGALATDDSNASDVLYGVLYRQGFSIMLFNETVDENVLSLEEKGLMGVELPVGTVSLTLSLSTGSLPSGFDAGDFQSVLWDYCANETLSPGAVGLWNRTLNFSSVNSTISSVPKTCSGQKSTSATGDCYDGGTWSITALSDGSTRTSAGTQTSTTYTFTVSGFDFDFDTWHFPSYTTIDAAAYTGTFTSCLFDVLQAFPEELASSSMNKSFSLKAEVGALEVNGMSISIDDEKACTSDNLGGSSDNSRTTTVTTYISPSVSYYYHYKSFGSSGSNYYVSGSNNYAYNWAAYGAYGFTAETYIPVGTNDSGMYLKDMNVLQLFDSEALEVYTGRDAYFSTSSLQGTTGTLSVLYAADPLKPEGYDTNVSDDLSRMASVCEEDMIYFESLDELEAAGYVCVGVLGELRDCTVTSGNYSYNVPVRMRVYTKSSELAYEASGNEEDLELVSTSQKVGTRSVITTYWAYDEGEDVLEGVSWAGAAITSKNVAASLTADGIDNYILASNGTAIDLSTCGDYYLRSKNTSTTYKGAEILPVAYKTIADIELENVVTGKSEDVTFNVSDGETDVRYTVTVSTYYNEDNGTNPYTTADLTAEVALDEGVSLDAGTFILVFDGQEYALSAGRTESTAVTTVQIEYEGQTYDIVVTAVLDGDATGVTFTLEGMPLNAEAQLVFDGELTALVEDGKTYTATVAASGTNDERYQSSSSGFGNYDSASFDVVSLELVGIQESSGASVVEYGDEVSFTLAIISISDTSAENVTFMDILPYLEDDCLSNLGEGTYALSSVTIDFTDAEETYDAVSSTGVGLYLTQDDDVRSYTEKTVTENSDGTVSTTSQMSSALTTVLTADDGSFVDVLGSAWRAATLTAGDEGSSLTCDVADEDADALALYVYLSTLSAHETVTVTFTLDPVTNIEAASDEDYQEVGDYYANRFYKGKIDGASCLSSNIATTQVAKRTISGTVWEDADYDGVYDEGELLLSDVNVSLYRTDASSFDSDGNGYPQLKGVSGSDGETLAGLNSSGQLYAAYDVYGSVLAAKDVYKSRAGVVTTDEDGGYCFDDLEAGTYLVVIYADEYAESYVATVQDAGSDDSTDSDFVVATGSVVVGPDYSCDLLASSSLELPTAEELDEDDAGALYEVTDVDAGLVSSGTFSFTKTDSASSAEVLEGAVFALYAWTGSGEADTASLVTYDASDDYASTSDGWELVATATSDEDGIVALAGLLPGESVRLVEVVAPGGYVRPAGQWALTVASTSTGVASIEIGTAVYETDAQMPLAFGVYDEDADAATEYYLPNRAATVLPSSGGSWPWLAGVALLALAAAFALAGRGRRGAHSRR